MVQIAQIRVTGIVQGVGFRPFIWRLAQTHRLSGWVLNDAEGVLIECRGSASDISAFLLAIRHQAPILAKVRDVQVLDLRTITDHADAEQDIHQDFEILASASSQMMTEIPADAVPCPDCLAEIFTQTDRRFYYPFTNCTHCGPRYSIIHAMPYDRISTSMSLFDLCPDCAVEYSNPADRRFHAQPICCPSCGPKTTLYQYRDNQWCEQSSDIKAQMIALATAVLSGAILAIKGVGGYHLVCDATNDIAVMTLRQRKNRPHKPLAVMVKDIDMATACADIIPLSEAWLRNAAGSIVLVNKRIDDGDNRSLLSSSIAPDQAQVGLMLPMSPFHHLLMAEVNHPLVFTSANISGDGQIFRDDLAYQQLGGLADWLWMHNRPIVRRLEDSVVRVFHGFRDQQPHVAKLRLGRGLSPLVMPIPTGLSVPQKLTATGADSKPHIALSTGSDWRLSAFIGQLTAIDDSDGYQHVWQDFHQLHQHIPVGIAVDAHPHYRSTQIGTEIAEPLGITPDLIYHHHAHLAACMAEHQLSTDHPPVMGLILDGIGFGADHALLGCELLYGHYHSVTHCASLSASALLGGELANRQPWRNLLARLTDAYSWSEIQHNWQGIHSISALQHKPIGMILQAKAKGINSPLSSSAGRLFDAVAYALGIAPDELSYEGQAAMMLESLLTPLAVERNWHQGYVVSLTKHQDNGRWIWQVASLFSQLLNDVSQGVSITDIACRFHIGLAQGLAQAVDLVSQEKGCYHLCLSGGVWQNLWLVAIFTELLPSHIQLLTHHQLPANDANIAIGQLAVLMGR